MTKPDILIVLKNLGYRLYNEERTYDYEVVQRAIERIEELQMELLEQDG